MSILLEALKKSEQERQLGQTPTLHTRPDEPSRDSAALNPWVLLAMAVVSISVMSWFGWQQFRQPDAGEAVSVAAAQSAEGVVDAVEPTPQKRTLTETYQAEKSEPAAPSENPPGQAASKPDDRERLSRSVSNYTADNSESAPSVDQAEKVAAVAEPVPEPEATPLPEEGEDSRAAQKTDRRRGLEPHVTEPISYWELPQGIRDDLPPIKITVLVYAEHPGDRFLLTNGQRLVEKDQLEDGLVLDEIRKDGAVFLYRNYRFLVKG
ncbi:general secretion pathway protein GspB [Pseudomonadota bacterium]